MIAISPPAFPFPDRCFEVRLYLCCTTSRIYHTTVKTTKRIGRVLLQGTVFQDDALLSPFPVTPGGRTSLTALRSWASSAPFPVYKNIELRVFRPSTRRSFGSCSRSSPVSGSSLIPGVCYRIPSLGGWNSPVRNFLRHRRAVFPKVCREYPSEFLIDYLVSLKDFRTSLSGYYAHINGFLHSFWKGRLVRIYEF